jgi:hypothetical protein
MDRMRPSRGSDEKQKPHPYNRTVYTGCNYRCDRHRDQPPSRRHLGESHDLTL